MLPFGKPTVLLGPELPEEKEVEFTFVGGPFDGHKSTGTVKRELSTSVIVRMKKKGGRRLYLYRYAGDNTFKFERKEP